MGKRVFFLSSGLLRVYHFDGQLSDPLEFRADEEGMTNFSLYLEQPWKEPVYVLVDLVEEEFREETIPHVMGADRSALVTARLNRLFRDATYSQAQFQGRESEGRRDDRMLFTALIRPDLLAPWMSQLAKHKTAVAGIFSLPLITDQLRKLLKIESRYALMVTLQSSGGLRQTYYQDGRLKVSRLAMLPDSSPERLSSYVLGEVERVRRYLNSLRMLPADEALDVYILGTERLRADVERHAPTSITARNHVLTLQEVAAAVGIKGAYESRFSDRVFAHLLARKSPPNQYAPPAHTRYFRLHNMRRGMIAASLFLLMGSLGWSAVNFVDGLSAIQDRDGARRQASFYQQRYERARARLPTTPADIRVMRRVVDTAERLTAYETSPERMMRVLSAGLAAFPSVVLDTIEWRATTDPGLGIVEAAGGGARSPQPQRSTEAPTLYQIAVVTAHIDPFNGDYREALDTVRSFADALRLVPGVERVSVESMPLDIGPQARLSGTAERLSGRAGAVFALRVAMRDREQSREAG